MISRVPLVDRVIEALQAEVTSGRLAPGTKLPPEPDLMRRLGVGRSTLREAVRVLAHGGVLEVRQGDGTYVRATAPAEPLAARLRRATYAEVTEVRRLIEIGAAQLAAERRRQEDLRGMRRALDERRAAFQAGALERMVDADLDFHRAVVAASHNAVLRDVFDSFSGALRSALSGLAHDPELHRDATEVHESLYRAIEAGDAPAAGAITDGLLRRISGRLEE
jgi:GntR family transcriptional repressor for pyruvate dehydrogenase complex